MKTNQIIKRPMGAFVVEQRTKDGMFNASCLLAQWNSVKSNPKREMAKFTDGAKIIEFMDALKEEIAQSQKCDMAEIEIIKEIKGKNTKKGKTPDIVWMHPYLFIKFAMWINPRFEVQVIKFVYDQMIKFRNDAGDAYKDLSAAVSTLVSKEFMSSAMARISKGMNVLVFGEHYPAIRNDKGIETLQLELFELERKLAELINDGFIKSYDELIRYMLRKYYEKYTPKVFVK